MPFTALCSVVLEASPAASSFARAPADRSASGSMVRTVARRPISSAKARESTLWIIAAVGTTYFTLFR